ncbi:ABC transporter ATP-binding protein [Pusillimonas sp. MFBS29]|uniref:ABC transporter ATP-binding protein n=1 Tax=Pusillimonas sp. MFBS29 TaxID=2886690 RepID=UPI001D111839|nr:ABC transporter ATP-binding protein [Pusillimonas sp. MFBS29]MCC2595852.1 ABC transporter ATP-binding protein [Pusillimonas sp. MFBS29]
MSAVLEVKELSKRFGGLLATNNVSFTTERGEIVGVIGPNGAGKSTLFNLITGTIKPSSGRVSFYGEDITGCTPEQAAQRGLIRTFQSATVFKEKTVRDNLRIGMQFNRLGRPFQLLDRARVKEFRSDAGRMATELLDFAGLEAYADRPAGDLPYGAQKILGVAMALATEPKQLLMDEPAAGLNPVETESMGHLIQKIRLERQIDVVLVEHDMAMVTSICDRIVVINRGEIITIGTPEEIQRHPEVIEAYLGVDLEFD